MKVFVTGVTGFVGAKLVPELQSRGHEVVGFARKPDRVTVDCQVIQGDVVTGQGLEQALAGVDAAYYLIHSMEPAANGFFADRELQGVDNFIDAAKKAKLDKAIYLGGLVPTDTPPSKHLSSRLAVEEKLLQELPRSVALRASIVIGADSRSFRFLVRLIERLPVIALPAWRTNRTRPIDERDVIAYLVQAMEQSSADGRSLDVGGPDTLTYAELVERIRDHMLVGRPGLGLGFSVTPIASRIAAIVAGEEHELIGPLMEGLETDLLLRDDSAQELLAVRLHSYDSAVEHALREWETAEELAAR